MSEREEYTTTDFYTAALLMCLGYELLETRSEGHNGQPDPRGRTKRFCFEDSKELRAHILSYMNSKLEGNLRNFRDSIEKVKDIVHSG